MTDLTLVLGVLAVPVAIADTIPYVRDTLRGTTRPHTTIFSRGLGSLEQPWNPCNSQGSRQLCAQARCSQIAFFCRQFGH
jgi:hypothetical protein